MIFAMFTDYCFDQYLSEKIPSAVNRNKYRDPQPYIVYIMKTLELSLKWSMPISSLPQGWGNPVEEKEVQEPEGIEDTKKIGPLNHQQQSTYELTETKAACRRHPWICSRYSAFILCLLVQCFSGIPGYKSKWFLCLPFGSFSSACLSCPTLM